jgi:hypothetical protein
MKYVYSIAEAISVTGEISIYVASVLLNWSHTPGEKKIQLGWKASLISILDF